MAWRCWESRMQGRCSNEGRDKLWGRVYGGRKKKRRRRKGGGQYYYQAAPKRTRSSAAGLGEEWRPASDIRAVCLNPSFFDQRRATHPDQRASVADTHGRYGGEAWLHLALRSRHDLCIAIGWWKALERVVNGVDYVIVVSIIPSIDVDVNGRLPRKATGHNIHSQQRC